MASRLMNKKEQIKVRDDFMQLERESGELKLQLSNKVKGAKLYQHLLNVKVTKDDYSGDALFVIYSYDNTPFTQYTLRQYLADRGYTSLNSALISSSSVQFGKYINARLFYHSVADKVASNITVLQIREGTFDYHSYLIATATLNDDRVFAL